MPNNENSVSAVSAALDALDVLEEACDSLYERPFESMLPEQIKALRKTLNGLLKAAQDHYIQMYAPPKAKE